MWSIDCSPQVQTPNEPVKFTLNDFTERSLSAFERATAKAYQNQQPIVPIYVQSDGGSAEILFAFMSIMKSYRDKGMRFASVVSGGATSAGCCVFLYCDFRFMGEFSRLLFHSIQIGVDGNLPTVSAYLQNAHSDNEMLQETLAKHLKKPKTWFKKLLRDNGIDDLVITPARAVELGIIEEVRIPTFTLKISSEFSIV